MQITKTLTRYPWALDMTILCLGLIALYFLWLGSYPLFLPDEARYSEIAREMLTRHDFVTPHLNSVVFLDKPILYYWLQAISMAVFGINEWALRFFPVLFGIIGCISTYCAGYVLFNRRTALTASIILSTSPLYFGGAHYANLDLEVAVWISCTLLFFLCGVQTHQYRRLFLFLAYISAAFAFLTKGLIAVVFPGAILFSWLMLYRQWKLLSHIALLPGIAIFTTITAPWYILAQQANPTFFHYFFITQHFSRYLSEGVFNNPSPAWFYFPVVLLGVFPWTIFLIQAGIDCLKSVIQKRKIDPKIGFLLLWIVVIFTFFSIPHSKIVTYILPIFPALALLMGYRVALNWENCTPLTAFFYALTAFLAAGTLIGLLSYFHIDLFANIKTHLYLISIILVASGMTACLLSKQKHFLPLFTIVTLTSVFVLISVLNRAKDLNQTTAKPLLAVITSIAQPEDEIVNYYKFYPDVPLFLGHPIAIVANWSDPTIVTRDNWVRELWLGVPAGKTNDYLISENVFWERFNGTKRLLVLLNSNYFDQFKAHAVKYYILAKHNDILLISNNVVHQ